MKLRLKGSTITARLVRNVAVAMLVVLLATSGFLYWRVEHALDRQLDRDLGSYTGVVVHAIKSETDVPGGTAGQWYQVYGSDGELAFGSSHPPSAHLVHRAQIEQALKGTVRFDRGTMLPATHRPFRAIASKAQSPRGEVVVVTAISRQPRDEALRELLLQLAIADVLVLAAASYVGYRTARAALDPVERYRFAAESAGSSSGVRLPVVSDGDDEVTRLGHTLNNLLERIDASTRRERQFIADASHELRTPLSLLKAELELALLRPRSAEESRAVLSRVAGDVDRMIDLANALLDLEEVAAAAGPVPMAPLNVAALLHEVAARFDETLRAEGRSIEVGGEPVTVTANHRWVEAAVVNLVSNAVRHGAGRVFLRARQGSGSVIIEVLDEGPGFEEGFVDVAFDRFTRADISRTTAGSGLGLALVRGAAEVHGGSSTIRSSEAGAAVAITLPTR